MVFAVVCVVGVASLASQPPKRQFQFDQYPVEIYKGPMHTPSGLRNIDGSWRDESGKMVAPPEVTFAGEYYLAVHSCGADCRYYQLSNLRTGTDIDEISRFSTGEMPPKTEDGHSYLTILHYQPDSRLIIAEYLLDFDGRDAKEACRQQYFVLEGDKIRALSQVFRFCTEEHK